MIVSRTYFLNPKTWRAKDGPKILFLLPPNTSRRQQQWALLWVLTGTQSPGRAPCPWPSPVYQPLQPTPRLQEQAPSSALATVRRTRRSLETRATRPARGPKGFKCRHILGTSAFVTGTPSHMSWEALAHRCAPDDTGSTSCAHCQLHSPLF